MSIFSLILISLGLGIDSLSVSVAAGFRSKHVNIAEGLKVPTIFGVFHVAMPLIGWIIGSGLERIIMGIDHWIAFSLLALIGAKMVYSAVNDRSYEINIFRKRNLFILATATSIDALVIGISLALIKVNPIFASFLIGSVVWVMCLLGYRLGERLGIIFSKKMEILGGLILIFVGFKILFEHLF